MLMINETAVDSPQFQGAYFDGSLELLRELAVTNNVDAALPRLSAIVNKMLPHDALRMAMLRSARANCCECRDRRRAGHDDVRRRECDHR